MTPIWVTSAISVFGARMGLSELRLNEREAASVTFENGCVLSFEHLQDSLYVSVKVPLASSDEALKPLLTLSHPANRLPFVLRTAYLRRRGMALLTVRLDDRQVTPATLDTVFSALWDMAGRNGGETR